MRCTESLKGLDPPPEGGQVFRAVAFPICIRASEQTAMNAISPRLVMRLRSRGSRNRWWRRAFLRLRWDRVEGKGRRSMILSVLVGGTSRFGLRGGCVASERPSDWNKRERRGSVSSLDGGRVGRTCENGGVDDCVGGPIGVAGEKCRLGARYFGGGVTVVGGHLLSVDGTGIAGHRSVIMLVSGGEVNGADNLVCSFPRGSYTPARWALFSVLPFVYLYEFVGRDVGLVNPLIMGGRVVLPSYKVL